MPDTCSVFECSNRSNRDAGKRFFRIPKEIQHKGKKCKEISKRRRQKWLRNLSLSSAGVNTSNARVCSDHFVKGCSSKLYEEEDIDWAPTVNLGHQKVKQKSESAVAREIRCSSRECKKRSSEAASALLDLRRQTTMHGSDDIFQDQASCEETGEQKTVAQECQTALTAMSIECMENDLVQSHGELAELKEKEKDKELNMKSLKENKEKVKFYTGLPNFLVLMEVFNLCEPYIKSTHSSVLEKFEEMILVLMKLRLNLNLQYLAFRFNVSLSTASRIWNKWLDVLHLRLKFLIQWPDRDVLQQSMPMDFRRSFGKKVSVIIDCFQLFVERPSNLLARAHTWSNYKHHNTVKFLIGVTPQGTVSFISRAWGGRASDKKITEECGILKHLLPGDIVLADRGFNIEESVGFYCASLKIPAFTKGKAQLSPYEVEETRKIANVRIHVERVIGLVRRKYFILQSRALPIEFVAKKEGESLPPIDKIMVICCALTNLSESVVPLE